MLKSLLFLALAISSSTVCLAQANGVSLTEVSSPACEIINPQTAKTPAVEAGDGQVWWANYDLDASVRYIDGTEVAERYDIAVYIPAGLVAKGDASIDGFSFYPQTEAMGNVEVWVAKNLPNNNSDKLETVNINTALELNNFNDVKFLNQHSIPAGGLYVGMSFDIKSLSDTHAKYPLSFTDTKENRKNSYLYKTTSKRSWTAVNGNAYVKVLFGGGNFSKNAVKPGEIATSYVLKGSSVSVPLSFRNMGTNKVETISYTITTDGVTTEELTKAVSIEGFQNDVNATIDFAADQLPKVYDKVLTITKVNGQPNEYDNNTSKGQVITLAEKYDATPVAEVFTSTTSPYCPNAIVGIEKAKEKYGNKVVLLSVHINDVMKTDDYNSIIYNVSSLPSSFVNRQYNVYPSSYFLINSLDTKFDRAVPAKISLKAEWTGNEVSPSSIALNSTTTFCYDDNKANYGVAYVLVADGLKGTGSEWEQTNGYSGKSGSSDLKFWYEAPSVVSGLVYDNVPVAAWDIFSGAKNSVPTTVKNGQAIAHNQTVSIKDNKLIQDKNKLSAVALLIDRSNNQIVNAAQTAIMSAGQGVDNLQTDDDNTVVEQYDLSGRKTNHAHKGFTIVKMANGKSLKIVR